MSHLRAPDGTVLCRHDDEHDDLDEHRDGQHEHDNHGHEDTEHGHSHGLVDRSILRSNAGLKAVAASLAILALTAVAQLAVFTLSNSIALLADPLIGLAITVVILKITWDSWRAIRHAEIDLEYIEEHESAGVK